LVDTLSWGGSGPRPCRFKSGLRHQPKKRSGFSMLL